VRSAIVSEVVYVYKSHSKSGLVSLVLTQTYRERIAFSVGPLAFYEY